MQGNFENEKPEMEYIEGLSPIFNRPKTQRKPKITIELLLKFKLS